MWQEVLKPILTLILQNEGCTIGKRSSKAKKAPNFSKIHKKWESQLSKVNINITTEIKLYKTHMYAFILINAYKQS